MDIKPISFKPSVSAAPEMRADIARMMKTMQQIKSASQADSPAQVVSKTPETSFDHLLTQAREAVDQVNSLEQVSNQMKSSYSAGDPTVNLTDVVLSSQKSGLAFQALLSVRNKLLEAYRQIMDMPV